MGFKNAKSPILSWFKVLWGYIIGMISEQIFRGLRQLQNLKNPVDFTRNITIITLRQRSSDGRAAVS